MLQQIIRRGTTTQAAVSRFYCSRAVGQETQEISSTSSGKTVLKYGGTFLIMHCVLKWANYDLYGKPAAQLAEIESEINKEWAAIGDIRKELKEERNRARKAENTSGI